jgi:uncharacterized protein YdhG (YjbR/CyaY superfamily)
MAPHAFDKYLKEASPDHRRVLKKLADQIRRAAPGLDESISYGIPTFKYRGKPLLYIAAHKQHCSLYPVTQAMLDACGDEVRSRQTGKGTIRFTADKPLPARLVAKLTKVRVKEIDNSS